MIHRYTKTLSFIILLLTQVAFSQTTINWQWTLGAGSSGQDNVTDMVLDPSGNAIIVGKFGGPFTLNTNPPTTLSPHGIYDMYMAKISPAGNVLWVKNPYAPGQDYATAVDVDKQGNIFMLADFYDSLVYDSNATGAQVFQSNAGLSNIYLAKYSPAGNLLWAKNIGGISIDQSADLKVDTSGNVLVTGYFYKTSYFNKPLSLSDTLKSKGAGDIFIAKYKNDGAFVWVKQLGSTSNENAYTITNTQSGDFVLSGYYNSNTDLNPSPTDSVFLPPNQFGTNLFLAKYDVNGNYVWSNGITSNGFKSMGEVITDKSDNIFVTGKFNDTTDFDVSFAHYSIPAINGNSSIFFGKYNANGSLSWMKKVEHGYQGGQDEGLCITMDAKNDLYVGGKFWGQGIDFNTSPTDTFLLGSNSSNNHDAFVAKFSNAGTFKWAFNIGDSEEDRTERICIDATGALYMANTVSYGSAGGPIDFNIDPINSFYYQPLGGYGDIAITKYDQCILNDAATATAAGLTALQNGVQYQWVNCGVGYAPISGATSQTFLPTTTGNYACIITSSASCKDTTACLYFDACSNFNANITTSLFGVMTASPAGANYQWLTCESNGTYTAIAGETAQSFTPTANGSYACKISKNGCVDTTSCQTINNVGIRDIQKLSDVKIYPNPASSKLVIESTENISISISDVLGNQVIGTNNMQSGIINLPIESLPIGVYTIKCATTSGKFSICKFTKQE